MLSIIVAKDKYPNQILPQKVIQEMQSNGLKRKDSYGSYLPQGDLEISFFYEGGLQSNVYKEANEKVDIQ